MGQEQNWRIEQNSEDYLQGQKKQLTLADRRPNLRTPQDLGLGAGIQANAVTVTDFNDQLALYDGYYSADENTATNAPGGKTDFLDTALTSGVPVTSFNILNLTLGLILSGTEIVITSGENSQTFVLSDNVDPNDFTVSVVSENANFSYPLDSIVSYNPPVVGYVTNDAVLGGVQTFHELTADGDPSVKWERVFHRNPFDASSVSFNDWTRYSNEPAFTQKFTALGGTSIGTGLTFATLSYDSSLTDFTKAADGVINYQNSSVQVVKSGFYLLDASSSAGASTALYRMALATSSTGSNLGMVVADTDPGGFRRADLHVVEYLTAGTTVYCTIQQASGGSLSYSGSLKVLYLGPGNLI